MKKFEKFISLILLGTFVFNTFVPFVNASEINTSSNTEVKNEELDFVAKGNIEIETQLVLPIRNVASDINFNIYDSSNNKASVNLKEIAEVKTVDKNVRLNRNDVRLTANKRDNLGSLLTGMDINNNIVYIAVNLYGLTRDTYKIEVSGTNFVTYTTNVTLDDFSKRVSITNETGMFEIGDVNKDNKVDKTDLNLVLNATYQNDTKYDLNLDGKTDIADLNYITAIINGDKKSIKEEKSRY